MSDAIQANTSFTTQVVGTNIEITASVTGSAKNSKIVDYSTHFDRDQDTQGGVDQSGTGHLWRLTVDCGGTSRYLDSHHDVSDNAAAGSYVGDGVKKNGDQYFISTTGATDIDTNYLVAQGGSDNDWYTKVLLALTHSIQDITGEAVSDKAYSNLGSSGLIEVTGAFMSASTHDAEFAISSPGGFSGQTAWSNPLNMTGWGEPSSAWKTLDKLTVQTSVFEFVFPYNNYAGDGGSIKIHATGSRSDFILALTAAIKTATEFDEIVIDGAFVELTSSITGAANNNQFSDNATFILNSPPMNNSAGGTDESGAGHLNGFRLNRIDGGGAYGDIYPSQDLDNQSGNTLVEGVKYSGTDYYVSVTGANVPQYVSASIKALIGNNNGVLKTNG